MGGLFTRDAVPDFVTIPTSDVVGVEFDDTCYQCYPCVHYVEVTLKSGEAIVFRRAHCTDVVRLFAAARLPPPDRSFDHFNWGAKKGMFMEPMMSNHKLRTPINMKCYSNERTVYYVFTYSGTSLHIVEPESFVPRGPYGRMI